MLRVFLAYADQFRAVGGILLACFMFCRHAAPRRERFWLRVLIWCTLCLALGFAYVPIERILTHLPTLLYGAFSAGYWLFVSAVICAAVYWNYEVSLSFALFRVLCGFALEMLTTTFLRYLVVMMWLPDLPEHHPLAYVLMTLTVYTLMYGTCYLVMARPLQKEAAGITRNPDTVYPIALALTAFLLSMYATSGICEWVIPTMWDDPALVWQCTIIRYFCIGIRFLIGTAVLFGLHLSHQASCLRRERDLIDQLLREKGEQYEFNRENMEFIRRKCHDLKRQLRALEIAGEGERQAVLEETRRAAEFYDAIVHTGSEVLDTLLTEKSMLCANRGIRLSCTVNAKELGGIGAVDLYTMLSNALDNAIECVERLSDGEKKTVSFSMTTRGRMLCIAVENYYEGVIEMRNGYPVTSKADKAEHGVGVRSIHTLARRYGGDIRVSTEDQIFLLQVMVPLSQNGPAK